MIDPFFDLGVPVLATCSSPLVPWLVARPQLSGNGDAMACVDIQLAQYLAA